MNQRRTLGVGVIGASVGGSWGSQAHIPSIKASTDLHLAAIATSRAETAQASAAHFGAPLAFDDPAALARDPSVDIVAVCVRVPEHLKLVTAALTAGKHVYCEWPLGRDTGEAEEMLAAATKAGVIHLAGMQARSVPQVMHMRQLIEEGAIGRVLSASLDLCGRWAAFPKGSEYLQKAESGANFLTITGGHAFDAVRFLLGPFAVLSAANAIQVPEVPVLGTDGSTARTAPDHVAFSGQLASGAFMSCSVRGLPLGGSGLHLEVNGEQGSLLITANGKNSMIQMSPLRLSRIEEDGSLTDIEPPAACQWSGAEVGTHAVGVAQNYARMVEAIRGGRPVPADFATAVDNHRLIDAITTSAAEGRRVSVA